MVVKPKKLSPGDCVGVIAPCSPIGSRNSQRFKACLKALELLGLRYKLGAFVNKNNDYMAGTPQERATDINNFFADPEVKALWCLKGGVSGNLSLEHLDYKLIKKNPKIFIGYSDITNYTLALYTKCDLVTFYGPTLTTFADLLLEESDPYYLNWTLHETKKMLFKAEPYKTPAHSQKFIFSEKKKKNKGPIVITSGVAQGTLIGGHLEVLSIALLGTQYCPKLPKNTIFFLEGGFEDPAILEMHLWKCEQLGYFKNIKGMLIGRDLFANNKCKTTSYDILKRFGEKHKIPILTDLDFGHTDPMMTIPIGVNAKIDTKKKSFTILESAVTKSFD